MVLECNTALLLAEVTLCYEDYAVNVSNVWLAYYLTGQLFKLTVCTTISENNHALGYCVLH